MVTFTYQFVILLLTHLLHVLCLDSATPKPTNTTVLTTAGNTTTPTGPTSYKHSYPQIALRAFYVVAVVSALVILYFIVRAICTRRRKSRLQRYGVLRGNANDQMEMRPLSEVEEDDEDDDMTLFDISQQKRRSKR